MDDRRISYFFLGLGIGVAAGILFAPKSGEETRRLIRSRAEEGGDYLRRRAEEGGDYVRKRGEEFREAATDAVERGRATIQRQRDHWSAAVDAGRSAYRDAVENTETRPAPEGV